MTLAACHFLEDFTVLKLTNLFDHSQKIVIFDNSEQVFLLELLNIPKLLNVLKAVFVTKM